MTAATMSPFHALNAGPSTILNVHFRLKVARFSDISCQNLRPCRIFLTTRVACIALACVLMLARRCHTRTVFVVRRRCQKRIAERKRTCACHAQEKDQTKESTMPHVQHFSYETQLTQDSRRARKYLPCSWREVQKEGGEGQDFSRADG